jgi:hypothetical protein
MYKILSKQNFSIALTLILTILLSQSNIMNLFFDTILGRIVLGLILLCISYTNQILGVVSTLLALVVFACCYNYTENFSSTVAPQNASKIANAPVVEPVLYNAETEVLDNNKYIVTEGFDILGTERNLQRGKKSNTIMVNEDMRKSANVDPYDGWNNQSYFTSIS